MTDFQTDDIEGDRPTITPTPGSITIGWHDAAVPADTSVSVADVLKTKALRKAIAHLAIEIGGKKARRHAWILARRLKNLAAQAAKRGEYLELHTRNQATAPAAYDPIDGLGLEVRAIRDHLIRWDIAIYSRESTLRQFAYTYRVVPPMLLRHESVVYYTAPDAATLVRRALRYFPIGYTAAGKAIWA